MVELYAGPCLLNDDEAEIEDCQKTALGLAAIDRGINFRCKINGGGTTPEKWVPGISGGPGGKILAQIRTVSGLKIGTEIRDTLFLYAHYGTFEYDFLWVAARAAQNYDLLRSLSPVYRETAISGDTPILIKRHPGMTVNEIVGIHDICQKQFGFKPTIIERGINTFDRENSRRWMPDFFGMLRILQGRPDIEICFDPSHACGDKAAIFPMIKAAYALGVRSFMLEVMNNPALSKTDQAQILSVEEFKPIHEFLHTRGN